MTKATFLDKNMFYCNYYTISSWGVANETIMSCQFDIALLESSKDHPVTAYKTI